MLGFFVAKDNRTFAFVAVLTVYVTVVVGSVTLVCQDLVLAFLTGVRQFWACMVLWETVGCAELSTAVGAGEGENRFG